MDRRGFTLIELMVVLVIIFVLICLFLPAVNSSNAAAKRIQCMNNLRQLSLGLMNYHHEREVFPPGFMADAGSPNVGWGWIAGMLAEIEQTMLSREIDPSVPFDSAVNQTARVCRISIAVCPSDRPRGDNRNFSVKTGSKTRCEMAVSSYVASFGTGDPTDPAQIDRGDGVFFRNSQIGLHQLIDGTSTTFLIGERSRLSGPSSWTGAVGDKGPALVLGSTGGDAGPNALPRRPTQFSSPHERGAHFAFGDGSVRFIENNIGAAIYGAMATRNGGEIVPDLDE